MLSTGVGRGCPVNNLSIFASAHVSWNRFFTFPSLFLYIQRKTLLHLNIWYIFSRKNKKRFMFILLTSWLTISLNLVSCVHFSVFFFKLKFTLKCLMNFSFIDCEHFYLISQIYSCILYSRLSYGIISVGLLI